MVGGGERTSGGGERGEDKQEEKQEDIQNKLPPLPWGERWLAPTVFGFQL